MITKYQGTRNHIENLKFRGKVLIHVITEQAPAAPFNFWRYFKATSFVRFASIEMHLN